MCYKGEKFLWLESVCLNKINGRYKVELLKIK